MSPQGVRPKTILVVDDDSVVLKALYSILSHHGYEVLQAQTVDEAIGEVQRHPAALDLLVTDAVMPKMSGPELADILLLLRPDMKVLFLTGLDSQGSLLAKVQAALGDASVATTANL